MTEPLPEPYLDERELTKLHSLMDLGQALKTSAPQSIIDWNLAVEEERRAKRAAG